MKVNEYIKQTKGRSYDLPFFVKQDSNMIKNCIKITKRDNMFFSRHNTKITVGQNNILVSNKSKEELP